MISKIPHVATCYCEILYSKRLSRVQKQSTKWNLKHFVHAKIVIIFMQCFAFNIKFVGSMYTNKSSHQIKGHPQVLPVSSGWFLTGLLVRQICHFVVRVVLRHFMPLYKSSWIFKSHQSQTKIMSTDGWDLHFVVHTTSRGIIWNRHLCYLCLPSYPRTCATFSNDVVRQASINGGRDGLLIPQKVTLRSSETAIQGHRCACRIY